MADFPITLQGCGRKVEFVMDLDPNDDQDHHLWNQFAQGHCYEPELAWRMFRVLQEGNVAIDIGANSGFFTLLMSHLVGPSGMVFAFEPGSNNLPSLQKNLVINNVPNVQVIEQPLWCRSEPVTFYLNADSRGGNALFDPANWWQNDKSRATPQPVQMQATTLDECDISKERIKLIKIDTEGAEQKIFEGAFQLLQVHRPLYILAEINPHGLAQSGCDERSLRQFMRQFGYDMFALHANGAIPSLIPYDTLTVPDGDCRISNVLFSDIPSIAAAWPTVN